jgi:hypothetical protein
MMDCVLRFDGIWFKKFLQDGNQSSAFWDREVFWVSGWFLGWWLKENKDLD